MMSYITSDQLIRKLRTQVREMDVYELQQRMELDDELVLIDIRELDEWAQGRIEGAIHIPRGFLELQIENNVADRNRPIAVICAGGVRSLLGARDLAELGYTDVASVAGGFGGWKNAGFKFSVPRMLTEEQRHRYSRHTVMPEVGEEGQLKLLDASVLLIGAGAWGVPPLFIWPLPVSAKLAWLTLMWLTPATSSARSSTGWRMSTGPKLSRRPTPLPNSTPM
jgi:rhodanese-related sulfurtransferase